REDVGLVVHTGIYRSEFISEPALAAMAAGELGINHEAEAPGTRRTLAFDLMDGAVGTLHACPVAAQMLDGGRSALVLASEVENNAAAFPDRVIGLKETATAMLLAPSEGRAGFGAFHFRAFPEHVEKLQAYTTPRDGRPLLVHERHPRLA